MNDNSELIKEIAALRAEIALLRAQLWTRPVVSPYDPCQPYRYPVYSTGTWTAPTHGNWYVTQ